MIRHIVVFRFSPGSPAEQREKFEELSGALRPLAGKIDGLQSLRVDADPKDAATHWDAALVSEHNTWAALDAYQADPAHLEAVDTVNSVTVDKAIVDYEV